MIIVSKSRVTCGNCGAHFEVEWDPDIVSSHEKDMGIESEYESEEDIVCEKCGNNICVRLSFWEYPAGTLELPAKTEASGTKDPTGQDTTVDEPSIEFFDL